MLDTENLHELAEAIPHIVWSASPDGHIDYCNQFGLRALELSVDDMTSGAWVDIIHPEERAEVLTAWRSAVESKMPYQNKHRMYLADQRMYHWFRIDARPLRNERGEITKWLGITIDIQSEVNNAIRLAQNRAELETILDNLPGTNVYVFDETYTYVDVRGPSFEESPPNEAIIGKTVTEAFGAEWAAFSIPYYDQVLAGESFYTELSTGTSDYLLQGAPLSFENKAYGILVVREITQQKKIEQALRQREIDMRFLVDTISQLTKLSSNQAIFQLVAQETKKVLEPVRSVTVCQVDENQSDWQLAAYTSDNTAQETAEKWMGKPLKGLCGKIVDEQRPVLQTGKLHSIGTAFNTLSGGVISKEAATQIPKALGIEHAYTIGILRDQRIYGIATFLCSECLTEEQVSLIETVVQQAGIALDKNISKQKLQESEEKYRSLIANMREGLLLVTSQGTIDLVNEAATQILGVSYNKLLGASIYQLPFHVTVDEQMLREPKTNPIVQALQKKKVQRGIIMGVYQQPERVTWISMNAAPTFNSEGTLDTVVVSFTDISKLKRSEDKLSLYLRQQTILANIAQKLNTAYHLDAVLEEVLALAGEHTDVSRVYVFENIEKGKACQNTYEWCAKGIEPQKENLQYVPYSAIKPWRQLLIRKRIIATNDISTLSPEIFEILEPQGIKSILVLPLFILDQFFGFVGFDDCQKHREWRKSDIELLTLVTEIIANAFERKHLQKGLENSEKKLQQANKLAKLAHWEWIPQTGEVVWSKELYQFFQIPETTEPLSFEEQATLYTPESLRHLRDKVRHTLQTGEPYEIELKADPAKYGIKYFHVIGIPEVMNGQVVRLFGSMQDITQRKISALQIEEKNKSLQQLNHELDLILKTLSHDLKAPINQAQGLLTLLKVDPTNAEVEEHMHKSIDKLRSITNDLLDLAQNSRSQLNYERIAWKSFLQECIEEQEGNEGFEKIQWNVEVQSKGTFWNDSRRLRIILRNLLSNAIKYRKEEELPFVAKIEIGVRCTEQEASLTITDNGLGIAQEQLQQIFEMFYQVNQAKKGVGLGLHIVRQMVAKLGGEINVHSQEGEGSIFTLKLPCLSAETIPSV